MPSDLQAVCGIARVREGANATNAIPLPAALDAPTGHTTGAHVPVDEDDPGPWITAEEAAAWSGLTPQAVKDAATGKQFAAFRWSKSLRIDERSFGRRFGLPLPGPRERELAMDMAEKAGRKRDNETRLPKPPKAAQWLYWFYDGAGVLLYVGITNSGVKRMEQHGADKAWWGEVCTIKVDHFDGREAVERAEREAIAKHAPKYNVTYNAGPPTPRLAVQPEFEDIIQ